MKIILTCDHGGYELCQYLRAHLAKQGHEINYVGPSSFDANDGFPPFIAGAIKTMLASSDARVIAICSSGIGMSIGANRYKGVRAALCYNVKVAYFSRAHNDANVLCLGGRFLSKRKARRIANVFLATEFLGGKYDARMKAIEL